jgi:hypothetical protein
VDERDGHRGKNRPARSGSTIQGMPSPSPVSKSPAAKSSPSSTELSLTEDVSGGKGGAKADEAAMSERASSEPALSLDWAPDSRITMDFTGPPLELPDELEADEPRRPSEAAPLTLDLDELDEDEGALGLVQQTRKSHSALDLVAEMAERYALDDFTGALRISELVLGRDPDHPDARRIAGESRRRLEHLYTSRLGGLARVPSVALPDADLRWLGLDHRAGFLLSRVDGQNSIDELVDISGMPKLEALKTLVELLDVGAIRLV